MFRPVRPDKNDKLIKAFHSKKVPHFFHYAKDKELQLCESINTSVMNKIVSEISDTRLSFNNFKKLGKINFEYLTNNEYSERNEDVEKLYDSYNKCYGNKLRIEKKNTTNENEIMKEFKKEIHRLGFTDDEAVNILARYLYKKPNTRKKKLFWFIYGDILYNNLLHNIGGDTANCMICGDRISKELIKHRKCPSCVTHDKKSNGNITKNVVCMDCGKEISIDARTNTKVRCDDCYEAFRKKYKAEKERERRAKNRVVDS